jgi:hypothetical protein
MAALDGRGGPYTPLLWGCAATSVAGAACLFDRDVGAVLRRLRGGWRQQHSSSLSPHQLAALASPAALSPAASQAALSPAASQAALSPAALSSTSWWLSPQQLAAAYLPVLRRAPLMRLTALVCFQTALDVVVNTHASLSFSQAGLSPQV